MQEQREQDDMKRNDAGSRSHRAQRIWAASRGIATDSQGYTWEVEANLFQPLNVATRRELDGGAGGELGLDGARGKIRALHGSSALAINVFDYWRERPREPLARALGIDGTITEIEFERPFPTGMRGVPPHLDVTLTLNDGRVIAIESKFLEPYPARPKKVLPFRATYFPHGPGRWATAELPACQRLAESVRSGERIFRHLDAPQLLKHALGLARKYSNGFALWYLWYDVGDDEGMVHGREVEEFAACVEPELGFRAVGYQGLIERLERECGTEHSEYLGYLRDRYGRTSTSAEPPVGR
jgi:hypothetical protein